jgi:hypothetical protein
MSNDITNNGLKPKIIQYIEEITDPRNINSFNFKHPITSIIFIVFVSALCGANDWIKTEVIGNAIKDWLAKFIALPQGQSKTKQHKKFITI